jgi:hypothetical protein
VSKRTIMRRMDTPENRAYWESVDRIAAESRAERPSWARDQPAEAGTPPAPPVQCDARLADLRCALPVGHTGQHDPAPAPPVPVGEARRLASHLEARLGSDDMIGVARGEVLAVIAALRSPSPEPPAPESREALERLRVAAEDQERVGALYANDFGRGIRQAGENMRLLIDRELAALHAPSVREGEA